MPVVDAAPRELVYRAFTDPDHLAAWMAARVAIYPNFVQRPSDITSTVPSTTSMAVCSSMA
ncbi:SRPBCC domain-containing protein [Dactylosporangium sp. NPDC049525]|uniref:SRPBCC domain-containing protein n=1 Tax=Dactylosporangium sp. NPDC049525 TaxID=3154730 RepID=UPI00343CE440